MSSISLHLWLFAVGRKKIILTVVPNYQLKRLESQVFQHDSAAFMIAGNTFSVLGKGFSPRKLYCSGCGGFAYWRQMSDNSAVRAGMLFAG